MLLCVWLLIACLDVCWLSLFLLVLIGIAPWVLGLFVWFVGISWYVSYALVSYSWSCFWLLCSLFRTFTAYLPRLFIIRCFSADVTVFCFSHLVVYPLYWNRLVDVCYTLVNLVRMCCLSFGGLVFALYAFYMCFLPAGVISLCDCFFKYFCVFEFQLVAYVLYMCFSPYFVCLFACSSVVLHVVFSLFLVVRLFRVCSQQFLLICAVCWQFSNHHRCFWVLRRLALLFFIGFCFLDCVLFSVSLCYLIVCLLLFFCLRSFCFCFLMCCVCVLPFDFWLLFFFSFFALWICIACFCLFICFLVSWICFFFACAASFVFLLLFFLVAFACSFASFLFCCVYLFCLLVGFAFLVAFCFFICFLWFFVFALLRLLFVVAFSYLVKPSEIA